MISLLLALCLSATSQADSLILVSGEGKALDLVPHTIITLLQESGVALKGEEDMRSLEVSSLKCEEAEAGKAECSFRLKGEKDRRAVKDSALLMSALRELNASQSGLNIGSCTKDSCEFELSTVSCMVNTRMPEDKAGKYGCGLVAI